MMVPSLSQEGTDTAVISKVMKRNVLHIMCIIIGVGPVQ